MSAKQEAEREAALYNRLKDDPTWIVVRRHCKAHSSRGEIVRVGLSEKQAKQRATSHINNHKDWFVWAMPARNYFTPYCEV